MPANAVALLYTFHRTNVTVYLKVIVLQQPVNGGIFYNQPQPNSIPILHGQVAVGMGAGIFIG